MHIKPEILLVDIDNDADSELITALPRSVVGDPRFGDVISPFASPKQSS